MASGEPTGCGGARLTMEQHGVLYLSRSLALSLTPHPVRRRDTTEKGRPDAYLQSESEARLQSVLTWRREYKYSFLVFLAGGKRRDATKQRRALQYEYE